jgi:alcohol dehydrogenase class IV
MGEEKYVAMTAAGQAATQAGLSVEHSSQHPIVFLYQIGHRLTPIPIWTKLEKSLDLDC